MHVCLDIETNSLVKPTKIFVIVCKDIDTNELHIFREVTANEGERERFLTFADKVKTWIGHNILGYDYPVLHDLLGLSVPLVEERTYDTLILSKLIDYPRKGHSIENYGIEFGIDKIKFNDFTKYSIELENYCIRDVDICHKVYLKYLKYILKEEHKASILIEHKFQLIVNTLSTNGFSINILKLTKLLTNVTKELSILDESILKAFPPVSRLIREVYPKETKYGTLSRTDFRWLTDPNDLVQYNGGPFSRFSWEPFNPASHRQVVEVLTKAGWQPIDKTQGHTDTEREINRLKYQRNKTPEVDLALKVLYDKYTQLEKTGYKINENNLATLPDSAPLPARLLAKRILLESRRRSLTEWRNLVCTEIKIDKESIVELGHVINDHLIQSGVPRNRNITDKDIEKEISRSLDVLFCNHLSTIPKRIEKDNIILNHHMELTSKILIEWLKSKKVNASFVKENEDYLWITITGLEVSEGFFAKDVTQLLDGLKTKGLQFSIISERIKAKFQGIGAWTHRMSHQNPNTANIPNEFDTNGAPKLLGKEMRTLWQAPRNRLLVGVDADAIQFRIAAHYIDDPALTKAIVEGKKSEGTDPHSFNKKLLGDVCKTRDASKRFLFSLILGAGIGKLKEILKCTEDGLAEEARDTMYKHYPGLVRLRNEIITSDAKRGYFIGIDGRKVRIPGDTVSERKHLCSSGYLQNGEAVSIKHWTVKALPLILEIDPTYLLVNIIHDEKQGECKNDIEKAMKICEIETRTIIEVGEELGLRCPLAGSYYNDHNHDYTIGTNWYCTH